jgi:hypothetical protein
MCSSEGLRVGPGEPVAGDHREAGDHSPVEGLRCGTIASPSVLFSGATASRAFNLPVRESTEHGTGVGDANSRA